MVVQWLRPHAPTTGILVRELDSHATAKDPTRCNIEDRILHVTTKICCIQIQMNKNHFFKRKEKEEGKINTNK